MVKNKYNHHEFTKQYSVNPESIIQESPEYNELRSIIFRKVYRAILERIHSSRTKLAVTHKYASLDEKKQIELADKLLKSVELDLLSEIDDDLLKQNLVAEWGLDV
jgi:hypothetical protein